MSVENLVEWMFFLEPFIDDSEELSTKVGFNIRIEILVNTCKYLLSTPHRAFQG